MGDAAEMLLDGTLCEVCGVYIDGEGDGVPRRCAACATYPTRKLNKGETVTCNFCGEILYEDEIVYLDKEQMPHCCSMCLKASTLLPFEQKVIMACGGPEDLDEIIQSGEFSEEQMRALTELYCDEMPTSVQKARTGEPENWLEPRLIAIFEKLQ
jgi:hypothetical protein